MDNKDNIIDCSILSETNLTYSKKIKELKTVLNYIAVNYHNDITLNDLADCIHMNPNYFCKFFKELTQKTPVEYLNSYRIGIAMRLLEQSTYSVTEIGYMVGFENPKNFRRIFKKYVNMIPSDYRISYLEGLSL